MKGIASWICVVSLATLAGAQLSPKRIEPGKQLGKLSVGNVMDDMKWLKKPDYADASSGHVWQSWIAKKPDPRNGNIINSLDVYTSLNPAGKYEIRLIRSTSPTFATKDDIKVGSSFAKIKDMYPSITNVGEYVSPQFSAKVALFDDMTDGLAFEFKAGESGSVGRHQKCLSIWVHEPNMDLVHQYYSPIQYMTLRPASTKMAKTTHQ